MATNEENSGLIPVTDHELFQATTARGFEPGQIIFGRFELRRVLGRGGMGIVWLAFDSQLEQEVAIKVLPDIVMHDREAVKDMKRETKRSLQLNHHNIVRIYDFNQDEKGAGISMEFVDGETLSAAKAETEHGCFQVEDVAPWLEQICEALAYAHDTAKIVHRDLKPANIMLSKSNTIKVTDFGIARSISDSVSRVSMRHASSGTMVYMSPQQSTGARSSPSDDIYALGATIYDLLTGKPPFYSGNIQHQLESITPPSMTMRRAELERQGTPISDAWEKAIASCLEKEASKRPSSVQDLAHRLNLRIAARMPLPPPAAILVPAPGSPLEKTQVGNDYEKSTQPLTTPSAPPLPPKPLLPPGLVTPGRIKALALGVSCAALLIGIPIIVMWVIGKGSIKVNTLPPGATVTMGAQTLTSPGMFEHMWTGKKEIAISLDGFDPVQTPAEVTKDKVTDLGTISLTRSTGSLAIRSIPDAASFTLKLIASPVASETAGTGAAPVSGHAPWKLTALPTGKYQLTTSADDFTDGTDTIEVTSGGALQLVVDLVKENAQHLLGADELAAVNSDQPIPDKMRQDSTAKAALTGYYRQTYHGYLKIDDFKMAEAQLKYLSNLGVETKDEQQTLDNTQKDWAADDTTKFNELLRKERFASAEALLDQMDADETQPDTAALRDTLNKAKETHEQATQKALGQIDDLNNEGKQDQAYKLAVSSAENDSEEPRLQQRLATFELPMLSTYERVSNRFKAMDALLTLDSTISSNGEYMRLYGIFQKNLDRHNGFRARIAPLERQIDADNSRIADLRAEQIHNEKKATGYKVLSIFGLAGGIAGAAEGSAPGAVAGFGAGSVGQNGATARENDVHRLQGEIDEVKGQRQPLEDQLASIQSDYSTLQKTPIDAVQ